MKTIKVTIKKDKYVDVVKEKLQDIPGVSVEDTEIRNTSVQHLQEALDDIPTHDIPEEELYHLVQKEIDEVRKTRGNAG